MSSILIWFSILGWMIRYKDLKEKHKFNNLEKAPEINSSGFRLTHKEKLDYTIESNKIAKFSAKRDALSNDAKKEKWNKKIRKSEELQKNIMDATKIIAQKVNSDIWSIKP